MPFIVTTITPCQDCKDEGRLYEFGRRDRPVTCACRTVGPHHREGTQRVAVMSIDKAREVARFAVEGRLNASTDPDEWRNAAWDAPTVGTHFMEEGDTIGPIPDGTTVTIERVERSRLLADIGVKFAATADGDSSIVAAWNAEHGSAVPA